MFRWIMKALLLLLPGLILSLFLDGGIIPAERRVVVAAAFAFPVHSPFFVSNKPAFSLLGHHRRCSSGCKTFSNNGNVHRAWATASTAGSSLYSSANDDNDDDRNSVSVAGVSVSPTGFLVLLQSQMNDESRRRKVILPIPLTSPSDTSAASNNTMISSLSSNNITMPELFRENNDQTSVTSPEALTFLQLLNGVDMATPILPPDTLSMICVWYAFLLEEMELSVDSDEDSILVEDELGLSTPPASDSENEKNYNINEKFKEALDYVRAMVRTTLPPRSDGTYYLSYMDASPWQRVRVQLPRVWLRGLRIQEVTMTDDVLSLLRASNKDDDYDAQEIGRVPIQFTLECSVDDGTKLLEIPLFAIPSSCQEKLMQGQQHQQLDISNDILQELSHNFNGETSAAFMSLSLFHRYNRSGAGSADSPVLNVSDRLLMLLEELQQKEDGTRYCWSVDDDNMEDINNDIDTIIQNNGLPLYRPLNQIQEEDQRVLQHLEQQNFGKNPNTQGGETSSNDSSDDGGSKNQQQPMKKPTLTLEQQALQQRLKSAWKIAMQREDTGALEKIQQAMEDLEKEVMENPINADDVAGDSDEEESTLQKLQLAMQGSDGDGGDENERIMSGEGKEMEGGEEEVVGLIMELEEATTSGIRDEMGLENGNDDSGEGEEEEVDLVSKLEEATKSQVEDRDAEDEGGN